MYSTVSCCVINEGDAINIYVVKTPYKDLIYFNDRRALCLFLALVVQNTNYTSKIQTEKRKFPDHNKYYLEQGGPKPLKNSFHMFCKTIG
ncbi:hypothetical protein KUTeg_023393 [Tegillarca granosa]|uniref:Uncharacterized protein n=1 Tax=Tegillarca granosa TaxID=220873 RepID=A0ABQ9E1J8_TEGGR|nr:hypothetical protein KUTeg_023393 [Tegillarca granosa]